MADQAKKAPRVSVIIPSWNARSFVGECLNSLRNQSFRDFEVVVVENGSTDGSPDFITKNYPEVIMLRQDHNTGFAKAVNIGIKHSKSDYVALLNNDAIASKDWLKELVLHMDQHKDSAAAVSKILKQTKGAKTNKFLIDTTGDFYSIWGMPFPRGRDEIDEGQYDKKEEVFGACGGAVIYRREYLARDIGLFDEAFFAYYEDTDLSFRIRRAGYKIFYVPTSIVHHKVGATSGGGKNKFTRYHSVKNTWFLFLKEMPGRYFWINLPRYFIGQTLMLISSIRGGILLPHLKGLLVAVAYTPIMIIRRWRIALNAKTSSSVMASLLYKSMPPMQISTLRRFGVIRGKYARK